MISVDVLISFSQIRETAARCKASAGDALAKASELAGPQVSAPETVSFNFL